LRARVRHASLLTKRRSQWPVDPASSVSGLDDPASGLDDPASGPDDPASGTVIWPVALAPRIGRNAGRWAQSLSESGGPDHGPEGDHGRRAEPGCWHGLLGVSDPIRQVTPARPVVCLAGYLGTCGPRPRDYPCNRCKPRQDHCQVLVLKRVHSRCSRTRCRIAHFQCSGNVRMIIQNYLTLPRTVNPAWRLASAVGCNCRCSSNWRIL